MPAYLLGYKHLYLLTDLPAPGVSDGDVDDVAAAVLAAYALVNGHVSTVTLVFCNNGTERLTQFENCCKPSNEYGDLFKLYEALEKLTKLNVNFKFQSEEDFNTTPPPSPLSESLIIIISPITKDTVLTLDTVKDRAKLTFQGNNTKLDYNLKETIKKIGEPPGGATEEKYLHLISQFGLSSQTSQKKFQMVNIEKNELGTSLKKMFIGKKIGMSYALNGFVISSLENFFKPGGGEAGVDSNSTLRNTYNLLLKTVLGDTAEVNDKSPAKGNSLKPFLETLSNVKDGEGEGIINKINEIEIDDKVVTVLNQWKGSITGAECAGGRCGWCDGLEMFKFVIKFGIYVYGENFIKALFPGKKKTGENSWIDVMVAQPTPQEGDAQVNLNALFCASTPDMWDLYTVAHVLYPGEVGGATPILNEKIIIKLNEGLRLSLYNKKPDPKAAPPPLEGAAPIGGYKKTRKLKKHRTRKGHNRKRPTRKRNKSQKKRIRKTHHKRKLYKRR